MANGNTNGKEGGLTLSGNVMCYQQPEVLTADKHGNLGIKPVDKPFEFLKEVATIPLTVDEFGMSATGYPVIFTGTAKAPVAVMGVRQGHNLFVTEEGMTEPDFYVPTFARRYPFAFANHEEQDAFVLCVDRKAPMVTDQPTVPFFENGELSKYTQDAMEFCKQFEMQRQATVEFSKMLDEKGLFEQKTVTFQPRDNEGKEVGEAQLIAEYWAVSEEKLNNLSEESFQELRAKGAVGAIYAHMISLVNWKRIVDRALKDQESEQGQTPQL